MPADMWSRENVLRTVRFERPEIIPMRVSVGAACWATYPRDALQEMMAAHPLLYPGYEPKPLSTEPDYKPHQKPGEPYTDPWGCTWVTSVLGLTGAVVGHPLEDWAAFDNYTPPDPETQSGWSPIDWNGVAADMARLKERGGLLKGSLRHGHTFLTLSYLRGYTNLIFDMADEHPKLWELIAMVEEFNAAVVRNYLDLGVEWMSYPEDLGMQVGPMLSPDHLRKYIKPSYQRLMAPAREAGCIIHMHSDGDIRDLVDDLIDGGVEVINLQDLVNGIDWIRDTLKGRMCIDLDVDRQAVACFGTPKEVDALIRHEVETLGSKEGGLMMVCGIYPGIPLENIRAIMDAMEKYATYYA